MWDRYEARRKGNVILRVLFQSGLLIYKSFIKVQSLKSAALPAGARDKALGRYRAKERRAVVASARLLNCKEECRSSREECRAPEN